MVANPTDPKERSRLAQQKSRAKRKRTMENIRLRNEYLTSMVTELVENSLQFSDAVLDALRGRSKDGVLLQWRLREFVDKTLGIAKLALDADDEEEQNDAGSVEVSSTRTVNKSHAVLISSDNDNNNNIPPNPPLPTPPPFLPPPRTIPYGLLPSISHTTTPPPDTLLPTDSPLATTLFWNTLAYALLALHTPSSPVARGIFSYAMPFTSAERQRRQIARRLRFRPTGVELMGPVPGWALMAGEGDPHGEGERMRRDFGSIGEAMRGSGEEMAMYLDAEGVEGRVRGYCGVGGGAGWEDRGAMLSLVGVLVGKSVCIGDKPGWRRDVVDAAIVQSVNWRTRVERSVVKRGVA